jgi:Activator of Hsp90 ATPase homolog 1-like protein
MSSTRISCHINAPRADVYRALLEPLAVAKWKVPDGMNCHVHAFDSREGGSFRISLTDDEPSGGGKTTARTDARGGTDLLAVHEGLPRGLSPADNETGWRIAPAKARDARGSWLQQKCCRSGSSSRHKSSRWNAAI